MKKNFEEKVYCEIDEHGENAINAAFEKISRMIDEHPNSLCLNGAVNLKPDNEDEIIRVEFGLKNPTSKHLKDKFAKLPNSHYLHGFLTLTIRRWEADV